MTPRDYLDYLLREMVLSDDPDHQHHYAVRAHLDNLIAGARAEGRREALAEITGAHVRLVVRVPAGRA